MARSLLLLMFLFLSSCGIFKNKEKTKPKAEKYSAEINKLLKVADSYKGTPYKYGGTTKKGIDCSGFVRACYSQIGIELPRRSVDQAKQGKAVPLNKARPGDLVAFKIGGKVSHVGIIYKITGNTIYFIHASSSRGVVVDDLNSPYYKKHFYQIRRIIE